MGAVYRLDQFPAGTSVELYPTRQISGAAGEPTGTPAATATSAVVSVNGIPQNQCDFVTTQAGPMVATAIVGGRRASVRLRLGS